MASFYGDGTDSCLGWSRYGKTSIACIAVAWVSPLTPRIALTAIQCPNGTARGEGAYLSRTVHG